MPIKCAPWIESLASSPCRKGRINRGRVPPENIGTHTADSRVCRHSTLRPRPLKVSLANQAITLKCPAQRHDECKGDFATVTSALACGTGARRCQEGQAPRMVLVRRPMELDQRPCRCRQVPNA